MPQPYTLTIDGKLYGFFSTEEKAAAKAHQVIPTGEANVKIYYETGSTQQCIADYQINKGEKNVA